MKHKSNDIINFGRFFFTAPIIPNIKPEKNVKHIKITTSVSSSNTLGVIQESVGSPFIIIKRRGIGRIKVTIKHPILIFPNFAFIY